MQIVFLDAWKATIKSRKSHARQGQVSVCDRSLLVTILALKPHSASKASFLRLGYGFGPPSDGESAGILWPSAATTDRADATWAPPRAGQATTVTRSPIFSEFRFHPSLVSWFGPAASNAQLADFPSRSFISA